MSIADDFARKLATDMVNMTARSSDLYELAGLAPVDLIVSTTHAVAMTIAYAIAVTAKPESTNDDLEKALAVTLGHVKTQAMFAITKTRARTAH